MSPKFANCELILIYFLLLIPWPNTQFMKYLCSKDNSRLVRKIVRSKWMPILDKYQVKLPLDCALHPFRDIFAPRQEAKKRDRPTQWTCRLCGKSFFTEKYLDEHFERRHKSIINDAEDAICLSDFCDIMRCEVFQSEESASLKTNDQHVVTDIEVWGDSLGQNSALAKANAAYLSLIPSRASSVSSIRAAQNHESNHQSCQEPNGQNIHKENKESCEKGESMRSKIENPQSANTETISAATTTRMPNNKIKYEPTQNTQILSNTQTKADKVDAKILENSTNADNKTSHSGNHTDSSDNSSVPKIRANCKADDLSKLKNKCEFLVRSCIGSLLLSMTDQSFKEMEGEMNKAVCWYLSCDRYWEDGPLEPRAFPWVLILILVFVLSTGICFCYYIIWILFDSEEATINSNNQIYNKHRAAYQSQQQYHGPATGSHYYYQQAPPPPPSGHQQQVVREIYHEPVQYEYRHSPRRYMQSGGVGTANNTPTMSSGRYGMQTGTPSHQSNKAYQQEMLDRREFIGRPIAASKVNATGGGSISNVATGGSSVDRDINAIGVAPVGKHYNTLPRPLEGQHRHAGTSHQSLRGSSSSHEIIQNEIGHNEHYIYVTYPPDLKKRFSDK